MQLSLLEREYVQNDTEIEKLWKPFEGVVFDENKEQEFIFC